MKRYRSSYKVNKLLSERVAVEDFDNVIRRKLAESMINEIIKNNSLSIKIIKPPILMDEIEYSIDIFTINKIEFTNLIKSFEKIRDLIPIENYNEIRNQLMF